MSLTWGTEPETRAIAEQVIEIPEPDWSDPVYARFFRWPPYHKKTVEVETVHAQVLGLCCMVVHVPGDVTGEQAIDCGQTADVMTEVGPMCEGHAKEYGVKV